MSAAAGIRVLLDVSPIGSRPEARTGLARVALDLASALSRVPDIELSTCAWGSVEASRQFREVRVAEPHLGGLDVEPGLVERLYLAAASPSRTRSSLAHALLHRCGQAINICRNPLRGHDLRRFDVFHSTYARMPMVIRRRRRPVVMTVHDLTPLMLPPGLTSRQQVGITTRILRSIAPSDWVACVSEHTRRDFLGFSGHPEDRAVVIPNGVDHGVFFPVQDPAVLDAARTRFDIGRRPFVLTLSSLSRHKNLSLLAEAWPAVQRRCPDALLVVAGGSAADRGEIVALFEGRGDISSIRFPGFVSDEEFRRLASSCQAFLFPSLYEGFGLPVLEAMACGAPVICSNVASLPEVAGSAAVLVDPRDAAAWAGPIARAVESPLREAPDAGSLARARSFSWEACAERYASLYRRLAAGG